MPTRWKNLLMDPLSLAARAVFDVIRDVSQRHRRVRVRAHDAVFEGSIEPCVMINVVNLGQRPITITHVWLDLTPPLYVENPARPLPRRLEPDEPWETWVSASALGVRLTDVARVDLLRAARVRLSTGRLVKARPGRNVPAAGAVPGGS
jgi:hypothetical protein